MYLKIIKQFIIFLFVISLAALIFISCEKDNPAEPENSDNSVQMQQTAMGPMPVPNSIKNLKGILGTIKAAEGDQVIIGAVAVFMDDKNQQLISAGTVSVNGKNLYPITNSGQTVYVYPKTTNDPALPVRFDGSKHSWVVKGSSYIPRFSGSVTSPNGSVSITYPPNGATISLEKALTVKWSTTSKATICVAIMDEQGQCIGSVATGNSHTFSAAQLQTLYGSEFLVLVEAFQYNVVSTGGKDFLLLSIIADGHGVVVGE